MKSARRIELIDMKRGKPHQEIYRPGSGPLRKSNLGNDESEHDTTSLQPKPYISEQNRYNDSVSELPASRRNKKPEQMFYVVRPMSNRDVHDNERHTNGNMVNAKSKRYSSKRRGFEQIDDEWRHQSQESESRIPNGQRVRDTRSVEPSIQPTVGRPYEKAYTKPPSGRRHSSVGLENDKRSYHNKSVELAPRFRRKLLEDNKHADDWNGASLTFQGSSGGNNYYPPQNYNQGYSTLPNRHRGRGRMQYEYDSPAYRSGTPDFQSPCNSRPATPPHTRTRSNDNLTRSQSPGFNRNDRNDYRRNGRENKRQFPPRRNQNFHVKEEENWDELLENSVKTVEEEEKKKELVQEIKPKPEISNAVLDWSEEVELNDPYFEQEILSDALTRSSSVASLVDPKVNASNSTNPRKSKSKRNARRQKRRSSSRPRDASQESRPQDFRSYDSRRNPRDTSFERYSRDSSFDRNRRGSVEPENWRDEIRSRKNSEHEEQWINTKKPGVLVLPAAKIDSEQPRYPEIRKPSQQKSLFDHNNPTKPIIIEAAGSRVSAPGFANDSASTPPQLTKELITDQFGNVRPRWYDDDCEGFKSCRYPTLIQDIKRADTELQYIMNSGFMLINWDSVDSKRSFLKQALKYLLCKDLKFCQTENVEQHLWNILYHNIIAITRNALKSDLKNKEQYKLFLIYLIEEGTSYFESLITALEDTYKFKLNNFLGHNNRASSKGDAFVGLALVSAQKLLLFLGDLGRYREQTNETTNYGKCRQWYIKAHEINPKNGKPYNQLAVLAFCARRKLDAVYYYMRSLMSSNPVPAAKEYLFGLFDENSRKYEQGEKRREERLERAKQHMKQKESENNENVAGSLRHETWIHPDGGRRVRRTTQTVQEQKDSEEEDLAGLSSVEVNKRFVISYLHVHGKLIMKIGVESFHEAAMQMLKEFRVLLQHSPVPVPCNRFLQLLALNMFAIETTQLKDPQLQMQAGYRSELQERALIISLQMFNLILERCVALIEESKEDKISSLPEDVHVLLPAVKIWCDWLLCHSSTWNPPPSTQDYRVGGSGDCWSRLAHLMNLLEKLDQSTVLSLVPEPQEGYEQIRLPEDTVLCGFTPLMVNEPDIRFAPKDSEIEIAQLSLRVQKLLFFGTVFLCGLEPPVLKLDIEDYVREYVSVVCTSNSRNSPISSQLPGRNNDVLMESFSDEDKEELSGLDEVPSEEVRDLLTRKVELERRHRKQELHKQRVKKILSQAVVSVHIEVRPKYLVPDTNCFIDHLDRITSITNGHVYTLMVPIVVLSELEGLSRGGKSPIPSTRSTLDPQHVRKVAQAARDALTFLKSRSQAIKCVTTKGAVLSSTTFTTEDDSTFEISFTNDDKILATCLALSKGHKDQQQTADNEPKKLVTEVVLLTDDRNLRVKALARDVPVRELMDFMQWAGLG